MRTWFLCCAALQFLALVARGEPPQHTVLVPRTAPLVTGSLSEEPMSSSPQHAKANLREASATETTNAPAAALPEIVNEPLSSQNLRPLTPAPDDAKELELGQKELELGRQSRRAGDWSQAERCLTRLMSMRARDEFHRCALFELGLLAQDRKQFARAQQIFSQYALKYRDDPSVPEVLLRQGLLYREMGATALALTKFYSVMSSALHLKLDRLAYYQRMVLQAQAEIADTYFLDGKYDEAAGYFKRLLKLENTDLNREEVLYKLVRACSSGQHTTETLTQAQLFAELHPDSSHLAEVRFLQADALKQLGRKQEAMQVVVSLLEKQRSSADRDAGNWSYWQQRIGNELANQMFQEGDFLNALELYRRLGEIGDSPDWRLAAWYQVGLVYERLRQPEKAMESYARILDQGKALAPAARSPSLSSMMEMARWRKERLGWQARADSANEQLAKGKTEPKNTNNEPRS